MCAASVCHQDAVAVADTADSVVAVKMRGAQNICHTCWKRMRAEDRNQFQSGRDRRM